MSEQQEKHEREPVSLSVMVESAEEFVIKGTKYLIRPLFLDEVPEFNRDGLSLGPQFINLSDEERTKTLDKWIQRTVFNADGEPLSLRILIKKHWTLKDLRNCLRKLIDLSD